MVTREALPIPARPVYACPFRPPATTAAARRRKKPPTNWGSSDLKDLPFRKNDAGRKLSEHTDILSPTEHARTDRFQQADLSRTNSVSVSALAICHLWRLRGPQTDER
jgi:hypothetical protein